MKNQETSNLNSISELWLTQDAATKLGIMNYSTSRNLNVYNANMYAQDIPFCIYLIDDYLSNFNKKSNYEDFYIFDPLVKNEEIVLNLFNFTNSDKEQINFLSNEISGFYGYDLARKIDIFLTGAFGKIKKIIVEKYLPNTELLKKVAVAQKIDFSALASLSKKFKENEKYDFIVEIINGKLQLKSTDPNFSSLLPAMQAIATFELMNSSIYVSYYDEIFVSIKAEQQKITENTTLNKEERKTKLNTIIAYYNLLVIRIYEVLDILCSLSTKKEDAKKLSTIIYNIENEVMKLLTL